MSRGLSIQKEFTWFTSEPFKPLYLKVNIIKISSYGKPVNCLFLKIPGCLILEQRKVSRVVTLIGCLLR